MLSNQPSTAFVTSKAPAPEISPRCIYLIRIYKIFYTSCLFPFLENEKVLSKNFWMTVQMVRGCRKLSSIYFFFVRGFKPLFWRNTIKCEIFGDGRSAPKVASFYKQFKKKQNGLSDYTQVWAAPLCEKPDISPILRHLTFHLYHIEGLSS